MLWVCGRFRCISVVGLWFWWCLLTVVCCFGFVANSSGSMVLIVVLAIFFLGFGDCYQWRLQEIFPGCSSTSINYTI